MYCYSFDDVLCSCSPLSRCSFVAPRARSPNESCTFTASDRLKIPRRIFRLLTSRLNRRLNRIRHSCNFSHHHHHRYHYLLFSVLISPFSFLLFLCPRRPTCLNALAARKHAARFWYFTRTKHAFKHRRFFFVRSIYVVVVVVVRISGGVSSFFLLLRRFQ